MSNDLISRKALNDGLIELFKEIDDMYIAGRVIGLLHVQPTAYDPDKVVERLEEMADKADQYQVKSFSSDEMNYYIGLEKGFIKAIGIVRGGVHEQEEN